MEEGKPTGIQRQNVFSETGEVQFGGRTAVVYAFREDDGDVVLRLDAGGAHFELYGYFRGSEFMEVHRERLN